MLLVSCEVTLIACGIILIVKAMMGFDDRNRWSAYLSKINKELNEAGATE